MYHDMVCVPQRQAVNKKGYSGEKSSFKLMTQALTYCKENTLSCFSFSPPSFLLLCNHPHDLVE